MKQFFGFAEQRMATGLIALTGCIKYSFLFQRPLAGGSDDDESDEDCLDTIPLMCGDSFEMDESDRLVKERRRRQSQYRSVGYFLSEGWINLCARCVDHCRLKCILNGDFLGLGG